MTDVTDAYSRRAAEYTDLFGSMDTVHASDGSAIEEFDHAVTLAYRWPASELQLILEARGFEVLETSRRSGQGHRPLGAILCRQNVPR